MFLNRPYIDWLVDCLIDYQPPPPHRCGNIYNGHAFEPGYELYFTLIDCISLRSNKDDKMLHSTMACQRLNKHRPNRL